MNLKDPFLSSHDKTLEDDFQHALNLELMKGPCPISHCTSCFKRSREDSSSLSLNRMPGMSTDTPLAFGSFPAFSSSSSSYCSGSSCSSSSPPSPASPTTATTCTSVLHVNPSEPCFTRGLPRKKRKRIETILID